MKKRQIREIFARDNPEWVQSRLANVIEYFVIRIKAELESREGVYVIYAWQTEHFQINLHKKARWVVAAVTTNRIIGLLVRNRFGNNGVLIPPQVRGPADLDRVVYRYAELCGASGRTPITGFGISREVYLDRPDGSFVKMTGLDRQRSYGLESAVDKAIHRYHGQ